MNLPEKHLDRLFAAARSAPVDTSSAEVGFETRLMAHIREERKAATPWFVMAWRMIPVFSLVVVLAGFWSFSSGDASPLDLYHAIDGKTEEAMLLTYLTGP